MALNREFKSSGMTMLEKNRRDRVSPYPVRDSEDDASQHPDSSSPDRIDTNTDPQKRDLHEDFYPDDNPDDPDPGLYRVMPDRKK